MTKNQFSWKWVVIPVLIVIPIYVGMEFFHLYKSAITVAKNSQALSKTKQVAMAIIEYADSHDGTFPSAPDAPEMMPYLKTVELKAWSRGFSWNLPLANKHRDKLRNMPEVWMIARAIPDNPKMGVISFADGRSEYLKKGEFRDILASQHAKFDP